MVGKIKSNVFGKCSHCGSLSIYGICQTCGFKTACAWCDRIQLPNGEWMRIPHDSENESHGICLDCIKLYFPDHWAKYKNRLAALSIAA